MILKRVSKLPEYADDEARSAFYQEQEQMVAYTAAMEKLIANTTSGDNDTAWLNALFGRIFVAIHTNSHVKDWLTTRLSRRSVEKNDSSFLGDILINNINVGNSLV